MSEEENEKIVCIRGESKKFDSREDGKYIIINTTLHIEHTNQAQTEFSLGLGRRLRAH